MLSEHDALFVECKPVDCRHAAGGTYCDEGVARFVDGDYAWAMEEGLMVGYCRDARSISRNLVPAIEDPIRCDRLQLVTAPRPSVPGTSESEEDTLYESRHRRSFEWVAGKGLPPRSSSIIPGTGVTNCRRRFEGRLTTEKHKAQRHETLSGRIGRPAAAATPCSYGMADLPARNP